MATTRTKIAACPCCCPDGGAVLTPTTSDTTYNVVTVESHGRSFNDLEPVDHDEPQPVWCCENCGWAGLRKVQQRPTSSTKLTQSQLNAIAAIQRAKLREGYEIKRLVLNQLGNVVSVAITVGMVGDEGTLASCLCRYNGHFFVGRRGKVEALRHKHGTKAQVRKHPLIFGWD